MWAIKQNVKHYLAESQWSEEPGRRPWCSLHPRFLSMGESLSRDASDSIQSLAILTLKINNVLLYTIVSNLWISTHITIVASQNPWHKQISFLFSFYKW